jgi:2-iminobutanoate/2-iminopropanoate deaminase
MAAERDLIWTADAPPPAGTYSQAIEYNGVVYISGQTGRWPDGRRATHEPFEMQAELAIANVQAIAQAAGTDLSNALQVTVYLKDPSKSQAFDAIYKNYVKEPFPSRAIVQSTLIVSDIEISAIVAK